MIAYSCRAPHVKIRPDELGSDLRDDGVARTLEDADSQDGAKAAVVPRSLFAPLRAAAIPRVGFPLAWVVAWPSDCAFGVDQVRGFEVLRAAATALVEQEQQTSLLTEEYVATEKDLAAARSFDKRVKRLCAMLRAGIVNEEVVAVGKVSPHKAVCTADTLALMRTNLQSLNS